MEDYKINKQIIFTSGSCFELVNRPGKIVVDFGPEEVFRYNVYFEHKKKVISCSEDEVKFVD